MNEEDLDSISAEECLSKLKVDPKQGLSSQETRERLSQYGENALEEKKEGWLKKLLPFFGVPFLG